jgi:hypothetical protein
MLYCPSTVLLKDYDCTDLIDLIVLDINSLQNNNGNETEKTPKQAQ